MTECSNCQEQFESEEYLDKCLQCECLVCGGCQYDFASANTFCKDCKDNEKT